MTEFYQGFWWAFPLMLLGMVLGYFYGLERAKAGAPVVNTDAGMAVLVSWALLGMLALFSGYPVFEALEMFRGE